MTGRPFDLTVGHCVQFLFEYFLGIAEPMFGLTERVGTGRSWRFAANVPHSHPTLGGHLLRFIVTIRSGEGVRDRFQQLWRFLLGCRP